ncbi:MAG TPA: chromate resistance protein ChrB domain-containing protein [Gemmatimonadaceae bacterium]
MNGIPRAEVVRWLLLIHQIPPKPDYLRVKIGRRLQRIGAVAIKNSVYVLPARPQSLEDFQWVRTEIVEGGGDASICEAAFVDGLTDGELEALLRDARARDYDEVAQRARALLRKIPSRRVPNDERRARIEVELSRLRERMEAIERIDFFGGAASSAAQALVKTIEERLEASSKSTMASPTVKARSEVQRRVWVTREGIFVDRIASAWLIRRFIDPEARFKFVAPNGYRPQHGELRFDMFEAEYTHEGDRSTFETLLRLFGLDDPALSDIAEVVHEIDLHDDKFDRHDARGIERVLAGIVAAHADDATRLERGAALFDDLYALATAESSA